MPRPTRTAPWTRPASDRSGCGPSDCAASSSRTSVCARSTPIHRRRQKRRVSARSKSRRTASARSRLESIRLRSIDLDSARLRSIDAASARLRSIRLRSIPLSEIPLTEVPGGWEAQLAGTEFADVPLQSLTLDDVAAYVPDTFTLESIDLSSTRLRSIRLRSILLEGTRLRSIPLSEDLIAPSPQNDLAWCEALIAGAEPCTNELVAALAGVELWEAQLAGADVDQPTVLDVPLSGLTSARLRSIDPSATDIEDARAAQHPAAIDLPREHRGLSAIRLRSIRLRSIPADTNGPAITLETIIDCSKNAIACTDTDANTLTLRDVAITCLPEGATPADNAACLLRDDADFGQLIDLLGVEVAGVSLLEGLTLGDILLAFSAPEDIPWESVDLQASPLQNIVNTTAAHVRLRRRRPDQPRPGDDHRRRAPATRIRTRRGRRAESSHLLPHGHRTLRQPDPPDCGHNDLRRSRCGERQLPATRPGASRLDRG